ncbi:MAG TPA: RNA polymerase sigma factor [Gaiellaceae bacterium]|nr:RNA polymerase sigma factor [Gaiellaceae bacterium]
MDEVALVAAAQRGGEDAFAAVVRPHLDVAFRLAYVITGSAAEAEDAVQDALVKAWRALGRFRAGEPVRPWLLRIVANEARNRRRTAGRRLRLALRAAHEPPPAAAEPVDRQALLEALHALPEDAQAVLACRYLLGLSEQETAATLDVAPGTVKSRTSRALERLRELYD